jgi:tetratricopeptide (TPR) repeat protein
VTLGAGAEALNVEARDPATGASAAWRLAVGGAVRGWEREVSRLSRGGDLDAVGRLAEARLASPSAGERGAALSVLARVAIARGERGPAEEMLRRAMAAHRQSGADFEVTWDAATLLWLLTERRAFAEAQQVLDTLPPPAGHAEAAYLVSYQRGLLAGETGDLRSGLEYLSRAVAQAARLGLEADRIRAEEVRLRELQSSGRLGEAEAARRFSRLLEAAEAAGLPVCDRAQILNNQAWSLLLAREAGEAGPAAADPVPLLGEALRRIEKECPSLPEERVNLRLNLALAHLQQGRPDLARQRLAEARRLDESPQGNRLLWWLDLEARVELAEGAARRALVLYGRLAERARTTLSPEAEWRAAFGRARAFEALGDPRRALAAYETAEALLDQEILGVPMDQGRAAFAAQRLRSTRLYLDLLLTQGREEQALGVVRRSRSRVLRTLGHLLLLSRLPPEQRQAWNRAVAAYRAGREELDRAAAQAWRLPADAFETAIETRRRRLAELRGELDALLAGLHRTLPPSAAEPTPIPPGEVLLAYHPLPDGWVGLAADARGVTARRLGALDEVLDNPAGTPAELARRLLEPFAGAVAAARRVRLLPWGPLREVDFHTLPFRGEPLLESKSVVWALDLPAQPFPVTGGRVALLVSDPAGDLPGARSEVEEVAGRLLRAPGVWEVRRLLGTEARGPAVRRLLTESRLFHYAGHAHFAGWDSALPLAQETRLTLGDVLALERSPEWVVLAGCETGRSPEEAPLVTLGLAQAFVAAGAGAVVAAVRPVPDREASALLADFYEALASGAQPPEALSRAQSIRRRGGPGGRGAAWASFRVFVP